MADYHSVSQHKRCRIIILNKNLHLICVNVCVGIPKLNAQRMIDLKFPHFICQNYAWRRCGIRFHDLYLARDLHDGVQRKLVEIRKPLLRADDPRNTINIHSVGSVIDEAESDGQSGDIYWRIEWRSSSNQCLSHNW